MFRIFDWLFPPAKDFYKMLEDQSSITLKGIELFTDYLCSSSITPQQIVDVEHEGDNVRRLLIDDLNKTFITPIDREDIFGLSRTVDDILDFSKSAMEEFTVYNLTANDQLKIIACKIKESVGYLHQGIVLLKDHPQVSVEKCAAAKDVVDQVETMYYEALAVLTESENIKYVFKMREIYKHLLKLSSRIDEAANIILGVIVKTS